MQQSEISHLNATCNNAKIAIFLLPSTHCPLTLAQVRSACDSIQVAARVSGVSLPFKTGTHSNADPKFGTRPTADARGHADVLQLSSTSTTGSCICRPAASLIPDVFRLEPLEALDRHVLDQGEHLLLMLLPGEPRSQPKARSASNTPTAEGIKQEMDPTDLYYLHPWASIRIGGKRT